MSWHRSKRIVLSFYLPPEDLSMSWHRSKRGRGTEVAAWTAGAFAEERGNPSHSEETRLLLEAHERVLHIFALLHHEDEVEVSSYGHFNGPGTHQAAGESALQTKVHAFGIPTKRDEPDEDRTSRLLNEAHQTQRALTDAHSPRVVHGETTPITPATPEDEPAGKDEFGWEILRVGAGLLPPDDLTLTDEERAAFVAAQAEVGTPTDSEGPEA